MIKTSLQRCLEEMKQIQDNVLDFLDNEENQSIYFQNLSRILNEQKISDDHYKLLSVLYLLVNIANNHLRKSNFYDKIFQILLLLKEDIKKYFSNSEIFNIFKSNMRILLFLVEEKTIEFDEQIVKEIKKLYHKSSYLLYFAPEMQPFKNKLISSYDLCFNYDNSITNGYGINKQIDETLPENFHENRKNGENESYICELIRNDSIDEFIVYINRTNCSINANIKSSIYETNSMLANGPDLSLIEYAAFYGSIQIFKYLRMNEATLNPFLWLYAIHGQNAEIIHFLEENHINPLDETYNECYIESIKCFQNDIANYIKNNFLENDFFKKNDDSLDQILSSYNFEFIENKFINENSFPTLCKYDYCLFVDILLKDNKFDINCINIQKPIFSYEIEYTIILIEFSKTLFFLMIFKISFF